jgi:hypothetical protein
VTEPDLTPYWADDEWTGFLIQLVPAARLTASERELYRQVRSRIDTDAVLYDLVTLAAIPKTGGRDPDDERVMWELLVASMAPGHFFAPRGVFAVVVLGEREADLKPLLDRLEKSPLLDRLRVWFIPLLVRVDPRTLALSQASVMAIGDMVRRLIEEYEKQPDVAIGEAQFLAELTRLLDEGYALPRQKTETVVPVPVAEPAPPEEVAPVREVAPDTTRLPAPRPRLQQAPALPASAPATQQRPLQKAVVHNGADMVFVQERSAWQRLRTAAPTDAGSIGQLAVRTDAVSLAYVVFVPDDQNQPREVTRRRTATALELDKLLGEVAADTETQRPVRVVVEVLSATSPLRRHGAMLPAGELTDGDLPKVPIDMFDLFETVDSLVEAMERSDRTLAARGVKVLSRHLIFLATVPLHDTNTTGPEWDSLLRFARITWVHFGSAEPSFTELDRPSPFGVHVLTDKDDIPALFRRESEVMYRWPPAVAAAPQAPDAHAAGDAPPAAKGRRWWPRRGPKTPES